MYDTLHFLLIKHKEEGRVLINKASKKKEGSLLSLAGKLEHSLSQPIGNTWMMVATQVHKKKESKIFMMYTM